MKAKEAQKHGSNGNYEYMYVRPESRPDPTPSSQTFFPDDDIVGGLSSVCDDYVVTFCSSFRLARTFFFLWQAGSVLHNLASSTTNGSSSGSSWRTLQCTMPYNAPGTYY